MPFVEYGFLPRLSQALFGLAFYLWKTLVPLGLHPAYELPFDFNPFDWPFVLSGLVVLGVSVALFVARRRWPAGLTSWACYAAMLAPVLGLAQSGPQIVADRYTYLSCLAWALLAGAGLFYLWQRVLYLRLFQGVAVGMLIALGVLTWRQTEIWHDSVRLWNYVLAATERSYFKSRVAHNNLGIILGQNAELEEAIQHYREALRIDPVYALAHNNLAYALVNRGEVEEAVEHYRRALATDPRLAQAHFGLGRILAVRGELEGAIDHFRQAAQIDPTDAKSHYNLGLALAIRGELEGAIDQFRQALRIEPIDTKAHYNLGAALAMRGELEGAIEHFRQALQIDSEYAAAHDSLGRVLAAQGKKEDADRHFQEARRIMKSRRAVSASK